MRSEKTAERRRVPADLIETTPERGGLAHWLLASPMILFIAWLWEDIFAYYSPLPRPLDWLAGGVLFAALVILPFGYLAHRTVTSLPRLFNHAGWDLQPLEPVAVEEQYLVRYVYRQRRRARTSWQRTWLRAAQGWVFLEIAAIFVGAVLMIPLFFSVSEFGFGG